MFDIMQNFFFFPGIFRETLAVYSMSNAMLCNIFVNKIAFLKKTGGKMLTFLSVLWISLKLDEISSLYCYHIAYFVVHIE